MRQETLENQFIEILSLNILEQKKPLSLEHPVMLTEAQVFLLINTLGEELGIDLSFASPHSRSLLLEKFTPENPIIPKDIASLLWLIFYSEALPQ